MKLQRIRSVGVEGMEATRITIEVALDRGLPKISIVGLPDRQIRESLDRVRAALTRIGIAFPRDCRMTINLAPASRPKEGAGFDLPIALGVAAAVLDVQWPTLKSTWLVGELALDGSIRPVAGILPMYQELQDRDVMATVIVSPENAREGAALEGIRVLSARNLGEAIEYLAGTGDLSGPGLPEEVIPEFSGPDFSEVRGQERAKRGLLVAAAGGHNVLMVGPPGTGKTLLARCFPMLLSPLTLEEAVSVTTIHSLAGLHVPGAPLIRERPWRAPHHTISEPGLIGGGHVPRPGEVSLAHHGVLFLDEVVEFQRRCLESLREPLEAGEIRLNRGLQSVRFPSDFVLVAAMNPCPCGMGIGEGIGCRCGVRQRERYAGRISGPILDRIDLRVTLQSVPFEILHGGGSEGADTEFMQAEVRKARAWADKRPENRGKSNALLPSNVLLDVCNLDRGGRRILRESMRDLELSARSHDRILRLGRTLADLEESPSVQVHHLVEAVEFRGIRLLDRA